MHRGPRLALRPHLVDRHPERPRSDSTEETAVLNEQCLDARSSCPQSRADSRRTTADNKHVCFQKLFRSGTPLSKDCVLACRSSGQFPDVARPRPACLRSIRRLLVRSFMPFLWQSFLSFQDGLDILVGCESRYRGHPLSWGQTTDEFRREESHVGNSL